MAVRGRHLERPAAHLAVTASAPNPVSAYLRAKDENLPEMMRSAFADDATLEMVVNAGEVSFPPFTRGLVPITEVLVTRFNERFENVRTICLGQPPAPGGGGFSCHWLVGMSEKSGGVVRVGCGRYDWDFQDAGLADRLRITIDFMEALPSQELGAVTAWLSMLPYPWCEVSLAVGGAPDIEKLRPMLRHLVAMEKEREACELCTPQSVLAENEWAYARPDNHALSRGHALVVPKRHVADFFDMTPREQAAVLELLREVQQRVQAEHSPDGYNIGVNVGRAGGQSRMHVHMHLIPRYAGDVPDPKGGVRCVLAGAGIL
jgi:diadenosine tetraphosphate (Ap4A) HIT family hydrolase